MNLQHEVPTSIERKIVNNGTMEASSKTGILFEPGADITNNLTGVINLRSPIYWEATGATRARVDNSGTINIRMPGQRYYIKGFDLFGNGKLNIPKENLGLVRWNNATVLPGGEISLEGTELIADGSLTIQMNARLTGYGTITTPLLDNQGEVTIGSSSLIGVGFTIIGNYHQGEYATLSTFVGANGLANTLTVQGTATLAGTLSVSFADLYIQVGDYWTLVESTEPLSGGFTNLELPPGVVLDLSDPYRVIARFQEQPPMP